MKKRSELISLIEMFDDSIDIYDKLISIRKLLKNNRIDINMMNLLIWFSFMQKKFKRLAIRIAKKIIFKEKSTEIFMSVNSFVSFFLINLFHCLRMCSIRMCQHSSYRMSRFSHTIHHILLFHQRQKSFQSSQCLFNFKIFHRRWYNQFRIFRFHRLKNRHLSLSTISLQHKQWTQISRNFEISLRKIFRCYSSRLN